jgi:hypothetical protein
VTTDPFDSPMAIAEGTDARILAGAITLSAVLLTLVGFAAVPDAPLGITASTLVPLLLALGGFLAMMLFVDPALTPKRVRTRDEIQVWLSKTFMYRLPAVAVPVLVGLLIAVVERERGVLLMGAFATLVLATVWWPGEQFFNAMRRRLQPIRADHLMDELLNSSNNRLFLRTR